MKVAAFNSDLPCWDLHAAGNAADRAITSGYRIRESYRLQQGLTSFGSHVQLLGIAVGAGTGAVGQIKEPSPSGCFTCCNPLRHGSRVLTGPPSTAVSGHLVAHVQLLGGAVGAGAAAAQVCDQCRHVDEGVVVGLEHECDVVRGHHVLEHCDLQ